MLGFSHCARSRRWRGRVPSPRPPSACTWRSPPWVCRSANWSASTGCRDCP